MEFGETLACPPSSVPSRFPSRPARRSVNRPKPKTRTSLAGQKWEAERWARPMPKERTACRLRKRMCIGMQRQAFLLRQQPGRLSQAVPAPHRERPHPRREMRCSRPFWRPLEAKVNDRSFVSARCGFLIALEHFDYTGSASLVGGLHNRRPCAQVTRSNSRQTHGHVAH